MSDHDVIRLEADRDDLACALRETREEIELLKKRLRIVELATPLEEDLAQRIDDTLKHLAMADGFTLNGIAQLLVDCQRRMAADWDAIGSERRCRKAAETAEEPKT